ncbi:M12 family metallo-peptidase, partial [Pseudarthrobacter sp. PvP090]|uniref:M12 family metallo-peptidase n=1 Tax=Pseudarthrobacter sp. PvP090 TaxID=3156393 RepID=UPI003395B667
MKIKRMLATHLCAALLAAATLTGLAAAPATAIAVPPVAEATTPEPPAVEQTGGAPTSVHTFQTPPAQGAKGAATRALSTEAYSLARSGVIKVRLVTVQLTDVKAAISMDSAVSAIRATSNYWERMSNGRLSMSVASTETFTSRKASSQQSYPDMMNTITNELGWVASPYTALVVFVSSPTLSNGAYGAGWSYNGTSGRVIMPQPASLTRSVLTHEFGHVLGLMHANSLECGSGRQDVATRADGSFTDSTCRVREYGDTMDLMGVSQTTQPTISSPLWDFGGFGTGREILNVGKASTSNTYRLTAWAGQADNRALKFTDPRSGEIYYLELRLPVGFDRTTAINGNRGVKIVQQFGSGSLVLMPNTRRFAGYYSANHAWQAGQTFTTHAGTSVTVNWISDSAASVTVESTPAAAVKAIAELTSSSSVMGSATSGITCGLRGGGCFQGFAKGVV